MTRLTRRSLLLASTIMCAAFLAASAPQGKEAPPQSGETKSHEAAPPKATTKKDIGDPYTLSTCIVSGMQLDSKGSPVVKKIDGTEVRFCCNGCVGKFEASKAEYFKKIQEQVIKDQAPHYPLTTCVVETEDALVDKDGKFTGVDYVYHNRLVRFCCKDCIKPFEADPAKYLAKLDEAVVKAQGADYPLTNCPVSGETLGSMGKPVDKVVANRLVRFCCKGCLKEVEKDPAAIIAKIDEARKSKTAGAGNSNQ